MCGGAGARLWPVSREEHPKPFIRLADGKSMLQKTWLRGASLPSVSEIMTVTSHALQFKTMDAYFEVAGEIEQDIHNRYVLEPIGRNTAPAIAVAALQVAEMYGENALMLVLAADHLIQDFPAFSEAVSQACELAKTGRLVTFGIEPDYAETGYGYIEAEGTDVRRFIEKPDIEMAEQYVDSGNYLWNSGMFCFSAGTLINEMQKYAPDILDATRACLSESEKVQAGDFDKVTLDTTLFSIVPDDSIDYAVMEKSNKVSVVACNIAWSDIGSWTALGDLVAPDRLGNRIQGEAIMHNAKNCYVQSADRLVAAVGVEDLIIVDTADALLIASRENAQDVKYIYQALKTQKNDAYKIHNKATRPWGNYRVLDNCDGFKIKRIEVEPGGVLSLQVHQHRCEHWVVVNGTAKVINDGQEIEVKTNESTYIQAGHQHRLENTGETTLVIIEVQTGDYLGEDDIERLEDVYGRA